MTDIQNIKPDLKVLFEGARYAARCGNIGLARTWLLKMYTRLASQNAQRVMLLEALACEDLRFPEVQKSLKKNWKSIEAKRKARERKKRRKERKEKFEKLAISSAGGITGALIGAPIGFLCGILSLFVGALILMIILLIMSIFMKDTYIAVHNTLNNPQIVDPNIVCGLWMLIWIVGGIIWGAKGGSNTLLKWFKKK